MADQYPSESKPRFRYSDALEVKGRYIAGEDIEVLAEEIARKRNAPYDQGLRYLRRIREKEHWNNQRNFHMEAAASLTAQKIAQNRADAVARTQGDIADRLIQKALEEFNDSVAKTRAEVLNTLEMGFRFAYRGVGLPHLVNDPAVLPQKGTGDTARRQDEINNMSGDDLVTLAKRLLKESEKKRPTDEAPPESIE